MKQQLASSFTFRLVSLFLIGPYDKFLEAQYNKAMENRDEDRACRAAIKRKDIVVEQSGQNLELNKVRHLLHTGGEGGARAVA